MSMKKICLLIFVFLLLIIFLIILLIYNSLFQQNWNIYFTLSLEILIQKIVLIELGIFLVFIFIIIYFLKNKQSKRILNRVFQPMPQWMAIIMILTFIAINLTFFFSPPLRVRPIETAWYIFHRFQSPEAITQDQARQYLWNSIRFYSLIFLEMISSFCYIIWKFLQN